MFLRHAPWSLLTAIITAGCQPGMVQSTTDQPDNESTIERTDDSGASEDDSPLYVGEWSGEVLGFVAFEEGWETEPYCGGEVSGETREDGILELSGGCQILWGPFEGTNLSTEISGLISSDGTVEAMAILDGDKQWFNKSLLVGFSETTSLEASAKTFYRPAGIEPVDAEVTLTAEHR
ncbi:MAG: hypothetical protein ACI8RZ_002084 [Myxococcota bacterium]|jgi:hypothetical protein